MTFEDLYVDCYFECGDASIKKCLYKTDNYAVILVYSTSHYNATLEFINEDYDFGYNSITTDKGELLYNDIIFENLKYQDYDTLKYK